VSAPPVAIERVRSLDGVLDGLAEILADAVNDGASVGFVLPFDVAGAARWWRALAGDVAAGHVIVWVARDRERVVGTVQLRLSAYPNQRHRADVAKLLVHRDARRRGIARQLMAALEEQARLDGRTLLVLDTISGSDADRLYRALGWTEAGTIPRYAAMPDGTLAATTYFWKWIA
jgi:ribosomal protein S18 acetylase RimI-like enzyme